MKHSNHKHTKSQTYTNIEPPAGSIKVNTKETLLHHAGLTLLSGHFQSLHERTKTTDWDHFDDDSAD